MPGYARCPKCRKPLPRRKQTAMGGTAVDSGGSKTGLIILLSIAIVGGGVITYLGLRSSKASTPAPIASPTTQQPDVTPTETDEPSGPEQPDTTRPNQPAAPDPGVVADRLEKSLKHERLWSTVSVEGARVDVRSGSCSDPKMAPILDATAPSLKAAGVTRLRCVEQSGSVVSDRDL
jgi:hypothetical protein